MRSPLDVCTHDHSPPIYDLCFVLSSINSLLDRPSLCCSAGCNYVWALNDPLLRKTIDNVMGLMGVALVLMETIMVSVMDSIGEMLNPIGKMPKTHYKKEFCNGFTGKN